MKMKGQRVYHKKSPKKT